MSDLVGLDSQVRTKGSALGWSGANVSASSFVACKLSCPSVLTNV